MNPQPRLNAVMSAQSGHSDSSEVKGFVFTEQSTRMAFRRKVYAILMCQLLVTLSIIMVFVFHNATKMWVQKYIITVTISSFILMTVCVVAITSFESVRRQWPINFIFLCYLTLSVGCNAGVVTAVSKLHLVTMEVVGIAAAVCLGLTLFAFQTKWDFTVSAGALLSFTIIIIVMGIIYYFIPRYYMLELFCACIFPHLFSIHLVYDIQLMMEGEQKYSVFPEEYIFAALTVYIDIINIFMYRRQHLEESIVGLREQPVKEVLMTDLTPVMGPPKSIMATADNVVAPPCKRNNGAAPSGCGCSELVPQKYLQNSQPCRDAEAASVNGQHGENGEVKRLHFTKQSIRMAFIKRVYAILACQLLVILSVIMVFMFHHETKIWVYENIVKVSVTSFVLMIVSLLAITSFESVRRKWPINFMFLCYFTLSFGCSIGIIATLSEWYNMRILAVVGITAAVLLGLTLFTFQTKWDSTLSSGALLSFIIIIIILGVSSFFMSEYYLLDYVCAYIFPHLFSIYLIYDTQLMMEGEHNYDILPEEYFFAVLTLYMDVVYIFLKKRPHWKKKLDFKSKSNEWVQLQR